MKVLFVSSFSPIVEDPEKSQAFYAGALGIDFDQRIEDYVYTEKLLGSKHLGLWPLREAAKACFGTTEWPADIPRPQASLEFDVDDVAAAADELQARGMKLIHAARTEPWGQQIARLLSPEGLLIG